MEQGKPTPPAAFSEAPAQPRRHPRLSVTLATDDATVEDAQRLRFKVFADELGASLAHGDGLDIDEFDAYCDHLVVRDEDTLRVVGTYRLLPPHQARRLGRLYTESEFDLHRLDHLRLTMVELGRSCVHRDYRSGPSLMLLWAGLARYMKANRYTHAVGCASVTLADGGGLAACVRDRVQSHLAPLDYRVFPRLPFPHEQLERPPHGELPPLMRGYLRAGASVCGEPAWDPQFGTADFPVLVALGNMNPRFARHFDLLPEGVEAS
jgi:putative hemolysin